MHFHCGDYNEFLNEKGKYFIKINKYIFKKVDFFIILGKSSKELEDKVNIWYNKGPEFIIQKQIE